MSTDKNIKRQIAQRDRLAAGLCVRCGKRPPESDRKSCRICLDRALDATRRRVARLAAAGLCTRCGKSAAEPGFMSCAACGAYMRSSQNRRKRRNMEAGICQRCSRPAVPGNTFCATHLQHISRHGYKQLWQALTILGGKCVVCNQTDYMYLVLDHVENDGAEDRRNGFTSAKMVRGIIDGTYPTERIQILCANCHNAKHRNGGVLYSPNY